MNTEIDTQFTRYATCPYCGYEDKDSWELHIDREEEIDDDCAKCGKTYLVSCCFDITYSTQKKDVV